MLPRIKVETTANDIKYALFDQEEIISNEIRKNGYWNQSVLELSDRILKNSNYGIVLDIGSGFGSFSLPLSLINDQKFQFHAFEAIQPIFYQLCTNILLNCSENIKAHNILVCNETGLQNYPTLDIHKSMNHGSFSFSEKMNKLRNIKTQKTAFFEKRRLDSYNFENVKLIKISTNGLESEIISGLEQTIKISKNPPIAFQCWEEDWYTSFKKDLIDKIKSLGYNHLFNTSEYIFAFKNEKEFEALQRKVKVVDEHSGFKILEHEQNANDLIATQTTSFNFDEKIHQ